MAQLQTDAVVCRNCGSVATRDLGPIGAVAPFVLKRVFNLETGLAPSKHPLKRFLRQFTVIRELARRIYGTSVLLDIQICMTCSFLQTKVPFPEEGLTRLYADYRSDSYNQERIHYEPEYASIASRVGSDEQEVNGRRGGLTEWLASKIDTVSDFSMLDYGGADGKFLPDLPGRKYVFDISDIAPVAGIERVNDEASLGLYSYVQLAHVLEHVPFPLALTRKACSYLCPEGYLYVEVPQDLSDEQIAQLSNGVRNISVGIHEHINYYTATSATKLIESAGLNAGRSPQSRFRHHTSRTLRKVEFSWKTTVTISSLPVIVLGAGNLGRRVARAVHPELFCDNNRSLWGTEVEGIPVESPATAVARYPNATFIVAIWHPSRTEGMVDRIAQLKSLGAQRVAPFTALLTDYRDLLLPHLYLEPPEYYASYKEEIAKARMLLDAEGREEFDRQMKLRMGDNVGQVIDPGVQYFPEDLFQISDSEVFIDCGAFDGDTIADFRQASKDRFERIIAFEPDPVNFASLHSSVNGDQRISLQPYATGARRETLYLSIAGTGSHISDTGTCTIEAVTLDDALAGITPTYIKFDIEGSEPVALEGGRKIITECRPKLAVCVYHAPDHLWSIPLQLHEMLPDAHLTLRAYNFDGFDCVCYCLPH